MNQTYKQSWRLCDVAFLCLYGAFFNANAAVSLQDCDLHN